MFATLANNEGDHHHIAFHPPYPYNQCSFYQHNTSENQGRAQFYNIFGAPTIRVQGASTGSSNPLLPQSVLNNYLGQTVPVRVTISEQFINNDFHVSVTIRSFSTPPTGSYKLYVAIAEREIQFNAPNGESLHHNVFRKMLPDLNGTSLTLPATGTEATYNFSVPLNGAWNIAQLYGLAWIQETTTNDILNSGNRFDIVADMTHTNVSCYGYTDGAINLAVSGGTPPYTYSWSNGANTQSIANLGSGLYSVTITDAGGIELTQEASPIVEPAPLTIVVTTTNPSSIGGSDGTATASVSGGTPPFFFTWSTGGITTQETGMPDGTYSVSVDDVNGCSNFEYFVLEDPCEISGGQSTHPITTDGARLNWQPVAGAAYYNIRGKFKAEQTGLMLGLSRLRTPHAMFMD